MKTFAAALLIAAPLFLSAQQPLRDSLENVLKNSPSRDSARVVALLQLARVTFGTDQERMLQLVNEAIAIAEETGYDEALAKGYTYLSISARSRGDLDKMAEYGMKTLTICQRIQDHDGTARAYSLLGLVHQEWGNYDKARSYLEQALKINLASGRKFELSNNYNNLGVVSGQMGNNEEAIGYFNETLKLAREISDSAGMAESYTNIAQASLQLDDNARAIVNFNNALRLMKSFRGTTGENVSGNLDTDRLATIYLGYSEALTRAGHARRAAGVADSALHLAKASRNKVRIADAYARLARIEKTLGHFEKALAYTEASHQYNDSVFSESKSRQIADLEAKYDLDKKERMISLLEKDNKIKALSRNLLIGGIASVVVIAAMLVYLQRQRVRRSQERLAQQEALNARLIEADQVKSRFFANISHEFRTPLTLIITPVTEKLHAGDLPQKDKIVFQSIRRNASRLLELINQLLEQSKLEAGFMKLETSPAKIYSFIMPVLSSFDSLADVGEVRFSKDIRMSDAVALFDADKLEKILNNLLSNAFKFTPPRGRIDVNATTEENDTTVTLKLVVRNAAVIPPAQLNRIFEPFFQADAPSQTHQPGTGLGLSFVRELVKLHGGEITVTSNEREGTIFTVSLAFERSTLPAIVPEPADQVEEEPAAGITSATDSSKQTILIVEDNREVRALIREGFDPRYNILEAATGKEGIEVAREKNVDLVISDVMMPVMGGIALCHTLKTTEITSHIPVLLLTARADHESKLEGLRTGADDYVVKPFNMSELQARVQNLLAQRRMLIEKYRDRIVVQPHEITVTPLDERFIQQVISVIESNLDNTAFDVEKLTGEIGMSRTNLHRKLKSITGMSASEFVQDFRLRRAALLIGRKADSISQIAFQVGFNDQSYFTKCFKKKFGKTPSEFAAAESVLS